MYKQIFNKLDGTPKLIVSDTFDTEQYTDIQPPNGLYEPIYFNGKEWNGASFSEWINNQPNEETLPDEKDTLIADLSIQLLETQNAIYTVQNDVANLTIQLLERE